MAGTSAQGILRALSGTAKPLYEASGVVEAPFPTIAELLARVTTVGPNLDAVLAKITRVFGFETYRER